jgi:ligand-binding sensor domain-containing protein
MRRVTFLLVALFCFSIALAQYPDWTVYDTTNSGLPNNCVYSMAIDAGGYKWIGTSGAGLMKYDGTNWTVYDTTNSGLPYNVISSIAIDASGNKWIATYGGGLAEFDGTNWTRYKSGIYIDVIAIDVGGNKWIGSGNSLLKFDGTNWTEYNLTTVGMPNANVLSIAIDANGSKWIGTVFDGLAKFDGTNWTVYKTSNSGLPNNNINSIAIDAKGNKWIGTDSGLAVFSGGSAVKDFKISHCQKTDNLFLHIPTPFQGNAIISYSVMEKANVSLAVYSLAGKRIKILLNETKSVGTYAVSWDAKDETGHVLPSGVYIYDFVCGKTKISEKMNLGR